MANPNPSPSTRFGNGQPTNRGAGRKTSLTARLCKILEKTEMRGKDGKMVQLPDGMTVGDLLAEAAVKHALNGNPSFYREIQARVDGSVPDKVEVSGLEQQPISYIKVGRSGAIQAGEN